MYELLPTMYIHSQYLAKEAYYRVIINFVSCFPAGNGTCQCTDDGGVCECNVEENTGLRYEGTYCECNPIICYSREFNDVSQVFTLINFSGKAKKLHCTEDNRCTTYV